MLNEYWTGKVLGDDKTVESCQIKEKDFLVLMVSKVRDWHRVRLHLHYRS